MTKTNNISISIVAQTKMALHASKHGYTNPIHGIVLGKNDGGNNLEIVDVVPVCHEAPTKPVVDMALRLTDAYLQKNQKQERLEGARIIGWYTANTNAIISDCGDDELPNAPACKIVASMAESDVEGEFVLLLVTAARLVDHDASLPICTVFERDHHRTYTSRVDDGRVTNGEDENILGEVLSKAVDERVLSSSSADIAIHDYVDHLNDYGKGNWIENGLVNEFVSRMCRELKAQFTIE